MSYDLKQLRDHFFVDPMWPDMEELILEYLAPFRSVLNINSSMSNDEIACEVRGRQLMVDRLDKFLEDAKVLRSRINKDNIGYK